jgi:CHAT domain-containing protein
MSNPQQLTVRELGQNILPTSTTGLSIRLLYSRELFPRPNGRKVLHVASGFQLVGFSRVVGTSWKADDEAAKEVAQIFYGSFDWS